MLTNQDAVGETCAEVYFFRVFPTVNLDWLISSGLIMAESENDGAAKRLKTDAVNERGDAGERSSDSPVSDFEITSILRECSREKNIFIHGKVRVQERDEKTLWEITK